ncbi:MAG: DUF2961 domain-containing protein [Clostridia bacterium]|nr:DUF2961 domain-containing protein [Clostridia bacterium]
MLNELTLKKDINTFSVCPENPTGKKGEGAKATLDKGSAARAARELGQGWKVNPYIIVQAGETATLADIRGEGAIKHFWITDNAKCGRQLILRIYFDDCDTPAVHAPLSDFFANADYNEYRQISSLAMCYNPRKGMNCYFEMPYFKSFRVELENIGATAANVYYQLDCEEKKLPPNSLYFHAQFRRVNPLPYKSVYTILDKIQGNGLYVGTYLHWGVKSNGWWGEGEIKFYIDGDTEFPSICGTGTEDYFCGAYDFGVDGKYTEFSTPYTGLSKVGYTDGMYQSQRYFDMYRWHITDPVYFKEDLRVTIQALGWRSEERYLPLQDDISSVAYWYSDNLDDAYLPMLSADDLELI